MHYIKTGSVSFTFSSLFYLFFSTVGIFPPFSDQLVFNMFFISIFILLSIYLINLLPIENIFFISALELLSVIAVLAISSFFFNLFPFTVGYMITVSLIGVVTYLTVFIINFIGHRKSTIQLNEMIQQQNEVKSYD